MRDLVGRLLASSLLLSAGLAHGQTKPYTTDTVLKLEELGRVSLDPTGQRAVFEHYRPYETAAGFDNGYYTRFVRSELMISERGSAGPAHRLLPEDKAVGYVLGAWSPSGERLLIFRFTGRLWEAGVYSVTTGSVIWLSVTPELPLYGPIAAWRTDTELVLITRADGDLPWHLRMNWEPNVLLSRLTAKQRAGETSAIVVGSGTSRSVTPSRVSGALVSIDTRTGRSRSLAEGRFQDLEVSPDGRYAAVADEGDMLPLDPARPVFQGDLQRARALRIVDLSHATIWEPAPGWDLLPNLLTWSDRGELLVWMRPRGETWAQGALKRATPTSRIVKDVAVGDATPDWGATSEQLPIARAGWLSGSPAMLSRTGRERAEWRVFGPDGAVVLTSRLADVPERPAALGGSTMLTVADGVVWRVDAHGAATALSSPSERLTEVRDAGRMFGLRSQFNDPTQRDWTFVRNQAGDVFRAGPRGLERIAGDATGPIEAVDADDLLQTSKAGNGVQTLQWVSAGRTNDLITLNPELADTLTAEVTSFPHIGPHGEALTSWLYSPRDRSVAPPLVVVPYPGRTYAAQPAMAEPQAVMTAINVQVLVGAGYAVLLPSLPRREEHEAADGLGRQIEKVIDAAALTGRFDPDHVVLWGHSFGGFGAVMAATQSDRFDGVIGSNGVYDFSTLWGSFTPFQRLSPSDLLSINSSVGGVETAQGGMGVSPWTDPGRYSRNSPFYSADKIRAPVLLIASDLDYVPLTEAEMMFSALYRQNKDATLVTYIGEGHIITSPGNIRNMYAEVLGWLDRIFTSSSPQTPGETASHRRTQASIIANSMMSP